MKIKFLGTGAASGTPAIFCRCSICESARKFKDKEIRSRSGMLIDEKLMIDFSADSFYHSLQYGFDMTAVETIVFTHSHADHFYPDDMLERTIFCSQNRTSDVLTLYGGKEVNEWFENNQWFQASQEVKRNLKICRLELNKPFEASGYEIIPLQANHMQKEECYIFLVKQDGKTYLHMTDSDIPPENVFEYLQANKIRLDALTMDCTYGLLVNNFGGHMDFRKNEIVKSRLEEIGAVDRDTKIYISHISHNAGSYEDLNRKAESLGMIAAYDGLEVEI